MSNGHDPTLVFDAGVPAGSPGTHVLIAGVGRYAHGKGAGATPVGGDLRQLSSPPLSASRDRRLVHGLVSEPQQASGDCLAPHLPTGRRAVPTSSARRGGGDRRSGRDARQPQGGRTGLDAAARDEPGQPGGLLLLRTRRVSRRQGSAMSEDFGTTGAEFDAAIDVDILRGTMKNSPAIQQSILFDCCRTEPTISTETNRALAPGSSRSRDFNAGMRSASAVRLFPTIDREEAFGVKGEVSVFSRSIIDALTSRPPTAAPACGGRPPAACSTQWISSCAIAFQSS